MNAAMASANWDVPLGAPVHDVVGEKIGKLTAADPYALVVSHGRLFQTNYEIRLSDVDRYEDGKLFLKLTKDEVTGKSDTA